jgi:hypothetical protein
VWGCVSLSAIPIVLLLLPLVLVLKQVLGARLYSCAWFSCCCFARGALLCAELLVFGALLRALPLLSARVLLAIEVRAKGRSKALKQHPRIFFSPE